MPKQTIEFRYDTQLLIDLNGMDEDETEDLCDDIHDGIADQFEGDELLCVANEDTIKLHFHTNEPWLVLQYCAKRAMENDGEIYDIVVEDMDRQSRGLHG